MKDLIVKELRKGSLTRYQLSELTHKSDRTNRELIAEINSAPCGKYGDVLIIATSDRKGYRLAEDEDDIKHFINERRKRAENILIPVNKAERMLRELE